MKLNNIVSIKIINNNLYKFIKLMSSLKIEYSKLTKEKEYFILELKYEEYLKLKKLLKKEDYEINYIKGLIGLKNIIKESYIFIITYIIGFILLFTLTNTIFKININTNDINLEKLISNELDKYGISKYKLMKDFDSLESIIDEILINNKDVLDWMSIERKGITYNINLTKRVKNNKDTTKMISDIVSSKDAIIKHIEYSKGVVLKEINEYVKKGETIISGNIIKSDKYLKGQVRSKGKVFGEVWYTVKVSVPFSYTEYIPTGLSFNEYYTKLFNKKITLINKYNLKNIMYKESVLIEKPYLPFKIYKREVKEYKYVTTKLNEKEAYEKAINLAIDKMQIKLNSEEYIIDKKVLKKTSTSSKIVLEVFFKVYERISLEKEIEKIEVGTDISKKGE